VVKRLVDIVLSAGLLLFSSPLLVCAAMLIRLSSPGPAIFRQTRVGRHFQPFEILKLRTMEEGQSGLAYTLGRDPRITPVGRILRETKIDELPQLWNVLRGDMSLVGPRPVVPEICEEFREQYRQLLRVRPGLTDPASIKYRQEARLLSSVPDGASYFKQVVTPDKLRISADYLQRANLWADGATMAMTAVVCCFPSLSRIYGRLPVRVPADGPYPSTQAESVSIADRAGFSHSLALLEAMEEQSSVDSSLPAIPLPIAEFGVQSTTMSPN
jgi:lipopolysaccharide/colanic/teichoic acid biosynthesis glycosyltransferase